MCECCVAQTDCYGEFLPGYYLNRANKDGNEMKTGDWGIVECNDPTFIFTTTPIKDPTNGMTDEQINALSNDSPEWQGFEKFADVSLAIGEEIAKAFLSNSGGSDAIACFGRLYKTMETAGWNKDIDGSVIVWLCERMADFLEKNPTPKWPYYVIGAEG